MAIEASHIRFALDLKDKYQIKDLDKYISGTLYPDSRYVSKINRELTHPKEWAEWDISGFDDFKKGWLVHLICDRTQYLVTKEKFPEIFEGQDAVHGNSRWIGHTALKILQDIDDAKKIDVKQYLKCLDHVENPNGEDINRVRHCNRIFQEMYADPSLLDIKSYYGMWVDFGIGEEMAQKVINKAIEFNMDKNAMNLMRQIYPEMLARII